MKKHLKSGAFRLFTFLVCLVMTVVASGINTFAAARTVTSTETCPYPLCTKKLMVSGPYGLDSSVIDSAVPFIGGKTYKYVYENHYASLEKYRELYHLYVIYCTKYDHDNASIFRHTMTLMFPCHDYKVTGYEQYSGGQHYTSYICDGGKKFHSDAGTDVYCLAQDLCGENAELSDAVMNSLMATYDTVGCGKTKKVLEDHEWSYGSWTSKDGMYHTRTGTCRLCGETNTQTGLHSNTSTSWVSISSTQHQRTTSCSVCNYSKAEKADHAWTYSNYTSISGTNHSVKRTCSVCGYTDTIQQNHNLVYGEWEYYVKPSGGTDNKNHRRTVSCSSCGYSDYEYGAHTMVRDFEGYRIGTWSTYGDTHYYSDHCSICNFSVKHFLQHVYRTADTVYTNISATQHHVKQTCKDCRWINEYDENHTFTNTCEPVSETQHKFTDSCICGRKNITYGDHHDDDNDCYCDDCGYLMTRFSVTVPATLSLIMDKDGNVYTPTNAEIINCSTADVEVTSVVLTPKNGWTVVPYATNMANEKVDAKKIGLKLRDSESEMGDVLPLTGDWIAPKDSSLPLPYSAVVSATSQPITGTNVLDVTFVIDWSD